MKNNEHKRCGAIIRQARFQRTIISDTLLYQKIVKCQALTSLENYFIICKVG